MIKRLLKKDFIKINGREYPSDQYTNVPQTILDRLSTNLLSPSLAGESPNPLSILKQKISKSNVFSGFKIYDDLDPVVTVEQNFDKLLFPKDHVGRSKHDTYYINSKYLLRTHTSAHQYDLLRDGIERFMIFANVFRRDEIDSTHFPVFHQMEAVSLREPSSLSPLNLIYSDPLTSVNVQNVHSNKTDRVLRMSNDLREKMEHLVSDLFGTDPDLKVRWVDAYFPFTFPSWELEIYYRGKWMEIAGCGIVQDEIIVGNEDNKDVVGWAFGVGLERVAMALFDIPDIRLFWSRDARFLNQFKEGKVVGYKPISKYPSVYKDVSFWINENEFVHENDFNELVRASAGDLVETVEKLDEFKHAKTGKVSKCFRITFRSLERTLSNQEVNEIQKTIISKLENEYDITIR